MKTLKRKFRSSVTAGNSTDKEKNTLPSETVPDQGLTVRQIITKYAQGTISDIMIKDVEYSEDMPDLRGLDIATLKEMKAEASQDVKEIQAELKRRRETANTAEISFPAEDAQVIEDTPSPTTQKPK